MSKNTKFVLQIIGSVAVFGVSWAVNNLAAVVMAVAILVVWAVNFLAAHYGVNLGRNTLTAILFVLSLVLAVLFNPALVPPFPTLPADGSALGVIIAYLGLVAGAATPIVGAATAVYNILLKDVLDQLAPKPSVPAAPMSAG